MPLTYCCASAVTATDVVETVLDWKPAETTSASAPMNRIANEMMKALLRSFDEISRSATSHALCAKLGAAGGVGAGDTVGADVVTG